MRLRPNTVISHNTISFEVYLRSLLYTNYGRAYCVSNGCGVSNEGRVGRVVREEVAHCEAAGGVIAFDAEVRESGRAR